jgi:hypothetical protein
MKNNTIDLGRTDEKVVASEVSEVTRLLFREFSHRINNEFASAIGVISVAARSVNNEAKVALAAVQDRLQTYALVHHALRMPEPAKRSTPTTRAEATRSAEANFSSSRTRSWRPSRSKAPTPSTSTASCRAPKLTSASSTRPITSPPTSQSGRRLYCLVKRLSGGP